MVIEDVIHIKQFWDDICVPAFSDWMQHEDVINTQEPALPTREAQFMNYSTSASTLFQAQVLLLEWGRFWMLAQLQTQFPCQTFTLKVVRAC